MSKTVLGTKWCQGKMRSLLLDLLTPLQMKGGGEAPRARLLQERPGILPNITGIGGSLSHTRPCGPCPLQALVKAISGKENLANWILLRSKCSGMYTYPFIYSFNKYLLSTNSVPNTLIDPEDKTEITREYTVKENMGGFPVF